MSLDRDPRRRRNSRARVSTSGSSGTVVAPRLSVLPERTGVDNGRSPNGRGVEAPRVENRRRRRPRGLRYVGSRIWQFCRILTAPARLLPDFLIIGAQRCGTTSLHALLGEHSRVLPAWGKEIHYFDRQSKKSASWYRSYFPSWPYQRTLSALRHGTVLTFEATPDYLFYPDAARRAAALLPNARLIVLLRNPVDRAYSQYHMTVRWGVETLSFKEAVQREGERLRVDTERMREDPHYVGYNFHYYSYLARGLYDEQLERWMACFPRNHILAIRSEDYFRQPETALRGVEEFLQIPAQAPKAPPRASQHTYAPMDLGLRRELTELFAPHNRRLIDVLGMDPHWSE